MELTIENLIKIILGIVVVVAITIALGFFFKDNVLTFFNGTTSGGFLPLEYG